VVRVCGLMICLASLLSAGLLAGAENPAPVPPAAPPALKKVTIAFPEAMFKDVPKFLIDTAAKPFQKVMQKEALLDGSMEVAADYKVITERLQNGKLDIAVFHGFEYAWVKDTPGLVPLVVTKPSCGKVQACLVVHVDCKAKGPEDLKGACVVVPRGSKAHCQMFMDRVRECPKVQAGDCSSAKPVGKLHADEVLDNVVGGTAEAAIVDISMLIAYQANKPGLGAQLKVLAESELLPPAVVVVRKESLTANETKRIRDGLVNCAKTPIGKQFVQFWNLDGFAEVTPDYTALLDKSRKKYPAPDYLK
jgi:ABC-type phosphate/phosphonate transport system substrate-binding protein